MGITPLLKVEGMQRAPAFALPQIPSVTALKDHWHKDGFPLAWDSFTLGNTSISSLTAG